MIDVGTHCRCAAFVDGDWVRTLALEAAIDRVSQTCDGFYFGRYDIRTPSVEDLKQGHNFKILELNGLRSEATYIYDARYRVGYAYRTLMTQWRIACDIHLENARRGAEVTPLHRLLRILCP